jgi:hypothetical protein
VSTLKQIINWIYGLSPAMSSIAGFLNPVELLRVVIPALLHGGGILVILQAVIGSASTIFSAPYAAGAVALMTAIVQIARLLPHGAPTPPAPTPVHKS